MNCREKGTKWDLPHLMFLAQQILADVEELFEGPFGEVPPDGMMAGPGGQPGYIMLRKEGGLTKFSGALNAIIEYMTKDAPLMWLELAR